MLLHREVIPLSFFNTTITCANVSANYTNVYIFCYKLEKQAFLKLFHGKGKS